MYSKEIKKVLDAAKKYLKMLAKDNVEPKNHDDKFGLLCPNDLYEHCAYLLKNVGVELNNGWEREALLSFGRAEGLLLSVKHISINETLSL